MMKLPLTPTLTVDGWLTAEIVEADGTVTARTAQHNLVTDAGLQRMMIDNLQEVPFYFGVGDGQQAPANTDTSLGHELGRCAPTNNGFLNFSRVQDGVYSATQSYEMDYGTGNGNLTEWGLFAYWSSQTCVARELFRDGNGNPIVVTKTSGQKLRTTYSFQISLGPVVPTAFSFNLAGVGTVTGQWCVVDPERRGAAILQVLNGLGSGKNLGAGAMTGSSTDQLTHDLRTDTLPANHGVSGLIDTGRDQGC